MACTSVVFPAPRSPLSQITAPLGNVRHRESASRSRSGRLTVLATPPPAGTGPGHTLGRPAHRVTAGLELEELVPKPGGQLEIELARRFPHLLLQRCDERLAIHFR